MRIQDTPSYEQKSKPASFKPGDKVIDALDLMVSKNFGSIVITDENDKVVGIVTERDLMIKVLAAKLDPEKVTLEKIMTRDIKTAKGSDDLIDWLQTMSNERFRHLPIVDDDDKLIKLVSQGDFVAYTWPDIYDKIKDDFKCKYAKSFQILLVAVAIITLGLIAFGS